LQIKDEIYKSKEDGLVKQLDRFLEKLGLYILVVSSLC